MPAKQRRMTRREKKFEVVNSVVKAKLANDVLSPVKELTTFQKNGLDVKIEFKKSSELSKDELDHMFNLLKENMETMYNNSDWGWEDEKKMSELADPDARYLIARDSTNAIKAFSHFRFDMDGTYSVLYCYELQIDTEIQRKGLGAHMMSILSKLAAHFKLSKVLLTVFKNNDAALKFYIEKLKFRYDETNPYESQNLCYCILKKDLEPSNFK